MKKNLIILTASLVTLVAFFYTWSNWSGTRQLQAAYDQLGQKKESTSFKDLIAPPVPDELNVAAAPIFQELTGASEKSRVMQMHTWKSKSSLTKTGQYSLVGYAKEIDPDFSGDEAAAGRLLLAKMNKEDSLIKEARQALAKPRVRWPIDYEKGAMAEIPHVPGLVKMAQTVRILAMAQLAINEPEQAMNNALMLLTLGDAAANTPPFLIESLVQQSIFRMAFDVIADGLRAQAWNDVQLASISDRLSKMNFLSSMADALRLERAIFQAMSSRDLATEIPDLAALISPEKNKENWSNAIYKSALGLRPMGWVYQDNARLLLELQRQIEFINGNTISKEGVLELTTPPKKADWSDIIITPASYVIIQTYNKNLVRFIQTQTTMKALRAACAIERYRLKNGTLPDNLTPLIPDFLPTVPIDPITGASLVYKSSPDGVFSIYGIGSNVTDDGGSLTPPDQRPGYNPPLDWGIKIPARH